jgi:hypothetical protein
VLDGTPSEARPASEKDAKGPANDTPLSQAALAVLAELHRVGALSSDNRVTAEVLAQDTRTKPRTVQGAVRELRGAGLVDTRTGRGGGCWLTDWGRKRCERPPSV